MNADKQTEPKIIHHHLGLGDHIICNGLVRRLYQLDPNLLLVVKRRNLKNVRRMFQDINLSYKPVNNQYTGNMGHHVLGSSWKKQRISFDQSFYKDADIPFSERWESFYVERDKHKEQKVTDFEIHNLISKKLLKSETDDFALVQNQDSKGKVRINIKTSLPIIYLNKNPLEDTIFDWMGLIDRASEIHCPDSSFIHLVDSMKPKAKLFFYNNRRIPFARRLEWETINC